MKIISHPFRKYGSRFAVLFCFTVYPLSAANYTVTDLGALTNLTGQSQATISAINLAGNSVGITASNTTSYNSFIYGGSRTNLGTLGGPNCSAQGINSFNVICGSSTTSGGFDHAFRWTSGATTGVSGNLQMLDLGTLNNGNSSDALDINPSGQIAGTSTIDSNDTIFHACRFNINGTITDIGTLVQAFPPGQSMQSFGYGINQAGQVVGSAYDQFFSTPEGFFYNGTTLVTLGDLTGVGGPIGVFNSEAFAINSSGQVVGYATYSGTEAHAFRWSPNGNNGVQNNPRMVDLGTLGGTQSSAWSINSSNVVVGRSTIANDVEEHAFITVSNTMVDLNTQLDASSNGWLLVRAEYINDAGQIVGYGTTNGALHGFLLMPIGVGTPPVITGQPSSVAVIVSNSAAFTVVASGTAPLAYQWRFNTTASISGATNSSLTINNARATNAGNYTVVITNSFGSVTSAPATLNIVTAPQLTSISVVNSNVLLGFTTSTGATYFVEGRTNLAAGSWLNVITNIAGIGGTKSVTHTNGAVLPSRFYRVRVTVP